MAHGTHMLVIAYAGGARGGCAAMAWGDSGKAEKNMLKPDLTASDDVGNTTS